MHVENTAPWPDVAEDRPNSCISISAERTPEEGLIWDERRGVLLRPRSRLRRHRRAEISARGLGRGPMCTTVLSEVGRFHSVGGCARHR